MVNWILLALPENVEPSRVPVGDEAHSLVWVDLPLRIVLNWI